MCPTPCHTAKPRPAGKDQNVTTNTLDFYLRPEPIEHPTRRGRLPDWIATQLHADHGPSAAGRAAKFHYCRRCSAIVLSGLDDDWMASMATADPTPIDRTAETGCIIIGRKTYAAWRTATGYDLTHRDPHYLDTPRTAHLLPAHRCGARFPGFITPPAVDQLDPNRPPPY